MEVARAQETETLQMNLKGAFQLVAHRIESKADSLKGLKRFHAAGLEGWLKVEACAALGAQVASLKNKGPDLLLTSGEQIELKAGTDLNVPYISSGAKNTKFRVFSWAMVRR